jgi:hypothetical protein
LANCHGGGRAGAAEVDEQRADPVGGVGGGQADQLEPEGLSPRVGVVVRHRRVGLLVAVPGVGPPDGGQGATPGTPPGGGPVVRTGIAGLAAGAVVAAVAAPPMSRIADADRQAAARERTRRWGVGVTGRVGAVCWSSNMAVPSG